MLRTVRALVLVLATLGSAVPAAAYDGASTQRVDAKRITTLATRVAEKLVTTSDRGIAQLMPTVDQLVPAGALAVRALEPTMTSTYISVPVQITVDGRLERTVYVGYRITTYVHAAVATHDLTYGAVISASDLHVVRVPSTGRPPADPSALVGRKLMHTVTGGTTIALEDTVTNPVVTAGKPAMLVVRDGELLVSVDVIAQQSGGVGDTVTVLNKHTNTTITGTVTGPGRVEFVLPGENG